MTPPHGPRVGAARGRRGARRRLPGRIAPGGQRADPRPARRRAGRADAARRRSVDARFEPVSGDGAEARSRYAPWVSISTPGDGDGPSGSSQLVTDEIDGQQVKALEISRSLSSVDHANTGLRQIARREGHRTTSLQLTADMKVFDQNVPGGGRCGLGVSDYRADQLL